MRIAVVNDLRLAVEALRRVVTSLPDGHVAWVAENGREAVDCCRSDRPDLILMDMIMPVMDGVEATRHIMRDTPCPILVTTATVTGNADRVYEALGAGAVDAVDTPVLGTGGEVRGGDELVRKIRTVMRLNQCPQPAGLTVPSAASHAASRRHFGSLVAIGASTGGPQALCDVLGALPPAARPTVLVAQHLHERFVPGLARWLTTETGRSVQLPQPGQQPEAGHIYLACTPDHLVMDHEGRLQYVAQPREHIYRPSVDVLFMSLLDAPLDAGTAVLLTGMGRDGAAGLKALRDAGWNTIVQDQQTSVVWGMPGAAVRLDKAHQVLPVQAIGAAIHRSLPRPPEP